MESKDSQLPPLSPVCGQAVMEEAIAAVAKSVHSPAGVLCAVDDGGDFAPVSCWNMSLPDSVGSRMDNDGMPGSDRVAEYLSLRRCVVELDKDCPSVSQIRKSSLISELCGFFDAWLLVPLLYRKTLFGFFILGRPETPLTLTEAAKELLVAIGHGLAPYLSQYRTVKKTDERAGVTDCIDISTFIVHDLKNIMGQLALIPKNAERHAHNPLFFVDVMRTVENAVKKIGKVTEYIRKGLYPHDLRRVKTGDIVRTAVGVWAVRAPSPELEVLDSESWVRADPGKLVTAIGNILQNAQEASDYDGAVKVTIRRKLGMVAIEVRDSGCGMDEVFIGERLFQPYETTKPVTGMGIGAYQAREFIREIGGDIEVESEPGGGTLFRISLPLADASEDLAFNYTEVMA
ncbi:MAG: ATP-binding protein [Gammaproteobacteria bacterium]